MIGEVGLESSGVVTGYTAQVSLGAVGLPLVALVRLRIEGGRTTICATPR